jgi:hypothetical protein
MPELHLPEDEAALYVLGGLSGEERRDFEARLAQSEELCALVRELENGAVALAQAAPQRRPPKQVWQRIEKAVARETKPTVKFPAFWFGWLRNGWAATAMCLLGWLLYAFFANRHASEIAAPRIPQDQAAVANSYPPVRTQVVAKPLPSPVANVQLHLLQVRAQEIGELRRKIAQMEMEASQLSRSLARQTAALSESNRIKFYQLVSASSASADANAAPLSPGLQRAMLMAIARELGWLPVESKSGAQTGDGTGQTPVNVDGVDFVNLRPNTNRVAYQPPVQPPAQSAATEPPGTSIPVFVAGDNLVVAVDSTVAPPDSSVTFTVTDANQNEISGTAALGENPMVVTIPLSYGVTHGGLTPLNLSTPDSFLALSVSSITSSGLSSTNWFFIPTNP